MPKASTGPAPAARPSANSPMTPVEPMRMTNRKYGSRKVMPPHLDTSVGKRQMLPMPTAEPIQAMMKPPRLRKPSRLLTLASLLITLFPFTHSGTNWFDYTAKPAAPQPLFAESAGECHTKSHHAPGRPSTSAFSRQLSTPACCIRAPPLCDTFLQSYTTAFAHFLPPRTGTSARNAISRSQHAGFVLYWRHTTAARYARAAEK